MTTTGEETRAQAVREMFGAIAGRYDFLNHFLSGNIDRRWRRACVRSIAARIQGRGWKVLDIGCGTADLSLVLSDLGDVVGCDFSHPMLRIGREKVAGNGRRIELLEADALRLPFRAASFDIAASAFVLRNLAGAAQGLAEMRRILRPGGVLAVLDFSMPRLPLLGPLYRFYFTRILPRIGTALSGVRGPYSYLPASVEAFASPEELKASIAESGFRKVEYRLLSGGIAVLLTGEAC